MAVTRIQFRRGDAADWAAENPTLTAGEPGYEDDTGRMKIGNGTDGWNALAYVGDPVAPMTLADVTDPDPSEAPNTLSPAVLAAAIAALATAGASNVYMMPIWDGTGTHPLRPAGTDTMFVIWRQPTAPLADSTHAHDGDDWEVTS